MIASQTTEPNLDRFEGEGGALLGQASRQGQNSLPDATAAPTRPETIPSWRVRPAFSSELEAILERRAVLDAQRRKNKNLISDADEEFSQRFEEKLNEQVIPQLESVAALLSKRSYPVELRVAGHGLDRACFMTVSQSKDPATRGLQRGNVAGLRMSFSADLPSRNVIYTANFRGTALRTVRALMKPPEITDAFMERELRQLFASLVTEEKSAALPVRSAGSFIKAVRNACA